MSVEKPNPSSPKWSSTFKMVVGLTIAGLILAMLIYFRSIIGPLILAFILIYLLHPLAAFLNTHSKLSWRASVNIIYIILLIHPDHFIHPDWSCCCTTDTKSDQ